VTFGETPCATRIGNVTLEARIRRSEVGCGKPHRPATALSVHQPRAHGPKGLIGGGYHFAIHPSRPQDKFRRPTASRTIPSRKTNTSRCHSRVVATLNDSGSRRAASILSINSFCAFRSSRRAPWFCR
jgi:hypothetical protein